MLTPAFELKQDDDWLTILIKAPFAKISETEIFIDGKEFKFYSKPYYLRLNLPGNIREDGREAAKYDAEKGSFEIRVPKETPGEYFEGLDMLTKLLAPVGQKSAASPLIEVIDGEACGPAENIDNEEEEEEGFDWQIEQEVYDDSEDCSPTLETPMYGFANQRSGVFRRLQGELRDIIDLEDADATPMTKRRSLRLLDEQNSFSDDHYLADLYQDEVIQEILKHKPVWLWEYSSIKNKQKEESVVEFTGAEKEKMRKLPRKEYLLDSKSQQIAFLGLVDIIFAYCYNSRTTEGENNVESGWTISKLSGTLSWLETYNSLQDVVTTSYRRCLSYPLYRSWKLNEKIFRDVQKVFTIGRRRILKCLLEIKDVLQDNESRYILNDLYITEYCVWIQSVSQRKLESLTRCLKEMIIEKEDVSLDLIELEMAAKLAIRESEETSDQEDLDSLTQQLGSVHLDADISLVESGIDTPCKKAHAPGDAIHKNIMENGKYESQIEQNSEKSASEETDESEDSSSEYTTDSDSSVEEEVPLVQALPDITANATVVPDIYARTATDCEDPHNENPLKDDHVSIVDSLEPQNKCLQSEETVAKTAERFERNKNPPSGSDASKSDSVKNNCEPQNLIIPEENSEVTQQCNKESASLVS